MPQAAAYRNDTHAMPHRDEKCSSPTSFFDTFFQKNTLPQSNTSPVITHQIINVSESIKQDMACRNLGNMIWHEIAESYEGGLLAISTGKSAKRALKGNYNPIYEKAHYYAGK